MDTNEEILTFWPSYPDSSLYKCSVTLLYRKPFAVGKERRHINKESATKRLKDKVKFEFYGEEMLEKNVKISGNSGRIYLPPDWVGHRIKVIRID